MSIAQKFNMRTIVSALIFFQLHHVLPKRVDTKVDTLVEDILTYTI